MQDLGIRRPSLGLVPEPVHRCENVGLLVLVVDLRAEVAWLLGRAGEVVGRFFVRGGRRGDDGAQRDFYRLVAC